MARKNENKPSDDFIIVQVVQGEIKANVLKSHLESEGIPVFLRYESAGRVFGIAVDGIGEVKVMVPREFADEARRVIEPKEDQPQQKDNSA